MRAPSRAPGMLSVLLLWVAWVAATVAGGIVYWAIVSVTFAIADSLATSAAAQQVAVGMGLAIVAIPFAAAALGGVPQAFLIRRLASPEYQILRMLWWVMASAVGGLLVVGSLLADITGPPTWDEVRYWYAPVTAVVALLTTSAQALALLRLVSPVRLFGYVLFTTIGWVVGWSLGILNGYGNELGYYLWFPIPFLCIGICSAFFLAPQLRARRDEL